MHRGLSLLGNLKAKRENIISTLTIESVSNKIQSKRFQTTVLEKTLESPLDSKEIKPVIPKENQP